MASPSITLRAPEPTDVDTLYIWENDPALWHVGFTHAPVSRQQLWEYVSSYDGDIAHGGQIRFMIVDDSCGRTIGTLDISDYDPRHRRAQVGIYIAPQARNQGFARVSLEMAATYCREILGIHGLYAMVAADNTISARLFSSAGYKNVRTAQIMVAYSGQHICRCNYLPATVPMTALIALDILRMV